MSLDRSTTTNFMLWRKHFWLPARLQSSALRESQLWEEDPRVFFDPEIKYVSG